MHFNQIVSAWLKLKSSICISSKLTNNNKWRILLLSLLRWSILIIFYLENPCSHFTLEKGIL